MHAIGLFLFLSPCDKLLGTALVAFMAPCACSRAGCSRDLQNLIFGDVTTLLGDFISLISWPQRNWCVYVT